MYIQFTLSNNHPGPDLLIIRYHLIKWAEQYKLKYVEKTIQHKHRVTFEDEHLYSHFAMTWNPTQNYQLKFQLIEPMKTRQH